MELKCLNKKAIEQSYYERESRKRLMEDRRWEARLVGGTSEIISRNIGEVKSMRYCMKMEGKD